MTHTPAPWTPYDRPDAIPVPSAWAGIPDAAYHADQMAGRGGAISGTQASRILQPDGPAAVHWQHAHPAAPSGPMLLGTAIHAATLGAGPQPADCGPTRRAAAWREKAAAATAAGATPLTTADYGICMACADAVHAHPDAAMILDPGPLQDLAWPETTLYGRDEDTGCLMRGRADTITREGVLVDLKSTSSPVDDWQATSWRRGYHVQAGHYTRIGRQAGIIPDDSCALHIIVTTTPPHTVTIAWMTPDLLDRGIADSMRACAIWHHCQTTGDWPGPDPQTIGIPRWAR